MQEVNFENNQILLIKTLGEIVKEHRVIKSKSIYKISAEASMSKSTWREVEIGVCKNVTLTTLWKIADGLEMPLAKLIEELSLRLGEDFSLEQE